MAATPVLGLKVASTPKIWTLKTTGETPDTCESESTSCVSAHRPGPHAGSLSFTWNVIADQLDPPTVCKLGVIMGSDARAVLSKKTAPS